jgi:hypothetical protein
MRHHLQSANSAVSDTEQTERHGRASLNAQSWTDSRVSKGR